MMVKRKAACGQRCAGGALLRRAGPACQRAFRPDLAESDDYDAYFVVVNHAQQPT
jgi:hypothetical protein